MTEFGCENETLLLHCPLLSEISIVRANYGRFSISVCNFRALDNIHTNCDSSHTTTDILKHRSGLVITQNILFPNLPNYPVGPTIACYFLHQNCYISGVTGCLSVRLISTQGSSPPPARTHRSTWRFSTTASLLARRRSGRTMTGCLRSLIT